MPDTLFLVAHVADGGSMPVAIHRDWLVSADFQLLTPLVLQFDGKLTKQGERFTLAGQGHVTFTMACASCLHPVQTALSFDVDEIFAQDPDDDDVFPMSADVVDIADSLSVNIITRLPSRLTCSDDCKGLCPVCGQNLNEATCGCRKKHPDPRFSALENLVIEPDRATNEEV